MKPVPGRGWWLPLGIVLGIAAGWRLFLLALPGIAFCWFRRWASWRVPALLFAAGIFLGCGALQISQIPQDQERFFPKQEVKRLELRFYWEDPAIGNAELFAPQAPCPGDYGWIRQVRLLAGREADRPDAPWQPLNGKLTVRFDRDAIPAPPAAVVNGGQLEAVGLWSASDSDLLNQTAGYRLQPDGSLEPLAPPGGSGWDEYLAARGLTGSFEIRTWRTLPPVGSWQIRFFAWRDAAMNRVLRVLPSPENRAMAAAMIFGCRGGLSSRLKQDFIRSGVIHLFTVSGLHVGILAGLLFWCCRWLPFRYRAWLLPLIALYVMMTGADAPAVRAFLMVLVLALVRSQLCWINGVQLLLWIAALLLLHRPAQLYDAGFQYTFLVTGFLLLAQPRMRELAQAAGAVDQLVPGRLKTRRSRLLLSWKIRPAQAVSIAGIAFAAAGALSLFHQGNFFPGSVLLNLALLPVLALNFLFTFGTFLLPGGVNPLLGCSLTLMNHLVQWGSRIAAGHGYLQPSGWSVALFLAALALWLAAPDRKRTVAGALIVLTWLGWRIVGPQFLPPTILVANGGSGGPVPTVLFCRPAEGSAVVIDPAGRNRWIKQSADRFGIGRIETVILTRPQNDCARNLERLPLLLPVAAIAMADQAENLRSRKLLDTLMKTGLPVNYGRSGEWQNGVLHLTRNDTGCTVQETGWPNRELTLTMMPDGVTRWYAGGQTVQQLRSLLPIAVEQEWRTP